MGKVVELSEWGEPEILALTAAEAAALRRVAEALSVEWLESDRARVGPKAGIVGIVSLSPDLTVAVRPRWPVKSLVELAAYALELEVTPDLFRELAALSEAGPQDWVALFLSLEVERLLAQGLRQGYREVKEEVPYVRGRIDFARLALRGTKLGIVPCRFADFVLDTEENRILRGTLDLLAAGPLSPPVRRWVLRSLAAFRQVSLVSPTRAMFDRIRLDRLNLHYRPALELCRWVVEGKGFELGPGELSGSSFFFPLNTLFEKALERALREAFPGQHHPHPTYSDRIAVAEGGPPDSVAFGPDNAIGPRDRPWLVVDAKYKRPTVEHRGAERFQSGDLYQAIAYALALGAPVVLVYPQVDRAFRTTVVVREHRITIATVDLGAEGVNGLRALAADLRAELVPMNASGSRRASN